MAVPTPKRMAEEARPMIRDTMTAAVRARLKKISFGRFHSCSSGDTSTLCASEAAAFATPSRFLSLRPR